MSSVFWATPRKLWVLVADERRGLSPLVGAAEIAYFAPMDQPWNDLPDIDEASRPVWTPPAHLPRRTGMGRHLVQVHHHVRQETRALVAAVSEVAAGNGPVESARSALHSLSLRQSHPGLGGFCSGYCELLTIHHSIEDRSVFPGLEAADPTLAPVLKKLFAEHEAIAELMHRLDQALEQAPADSQAMERLQTTARRLADQLTSHLDYEESQLVAALDAYARTL